MGRKNNQPKTITISIPLTPFLTVRSFLVRHQLMVLSMILAIISLSAYLYYYFNGLGLAYNDARSHLDIGRRVVEGLKTGLAQLGSVWLPLPHLLMVPTVWNDFFWHSGLSGALQSMISFITSGILVYLFLTRLSIPYIGRLVGVGVFVANINVLYLQSTAMTELLLIATMTAAVYQLVLWEQKEGILHLVYSALWVMLSTLIRYDGWFLFIYLIGVITLVTASRHGIRSVEGKVIFFATLGGIGIVTWFLWNLLIFGDPLYFALGPYSARAQQTQLEAAGELATKGDVLLSLKTYYYALSYNSNAFIVVLSIFSAVVFTFDRAYSWTKKLVVSALFAPFIFNILALYMGHSVLFVEGIVGDTWFNVRYGIMLMPAVAIMIGYLAGKLATVRTTIIGLVLLITCFTFINNDAVTIDDAKYGSSQKNVTEVSSWLAQNAKNTDGFVLISAASHDAIIFSSTLPMKKFIHEGTGEYWYRATSNPHGWARWIVMRTHDNNDLTFNSINTYPLEERYNLVEKYPFADIYELKDEYIGSLQTKPVLSQK